MSLKLAAAMVTACGIQCEGHSSREEQKFTFYMFPNYFPPGGNHLKNNARNTLIKIKKLKKYIYIYTF